MTVKKKEYSGKLIIRIQPSTHKALAVKANKKNQSLNGLIKTVLEDDVKNNLEKA